MKRWYIYVLRDPITWDVRYVGKSDNPKARLQKHVYDSAHHRYRNAYWVRSLVRRGLMPMLEVIDAGMGNGHAAAERAWIAEYRRRGASLTNTAPGGIGGSGPVGEETRRKLSAIFKGRKLQPEQVARIAEQKRGTHHSAETRAKMSASHMGHYVSPETGAKIAATKIGKPRSPETIAKVSASLTGRPLSEEHKAKLRVVQKARRERERLEREASCGKA